MSEVVDRGRAVDVTRETREDDGLEPIGSWVRQRQTQVWHASVAFDGYDHTTRCGATLKAGKPGQIDDVEIDAAAIDSGEWICEHCLDGESEEEVSDGVE